ncbi:DUF4407 domain-containing protein [Leptolyngbya sp. 7M]|uniref:DUF4407 domain-containing protein n=1 Tax=Leptolyngbya sp. 7M TaxID=2812896 RepID=UPI001B8C84B8|nr:DUF4407 domain-containing protein [Leptolyngbya sp. 7M]QYO65290.1 DUF4407 domain-containing protein [Leptolyngbya sp. 7M]
MTNDMQNTNYQPSSIQRFFWWLAGADIELLSQCRSDWHKFTAMGCFVAVIACLAVVSGTFFLNIALGVSVYAAIPGGIFWAILIVSLDRLLLTHFQKGRGMLLRAFPRLLLAIAIAVVISHPLLLKIYEGEINARLLDDKRSKIHSVLDSSEKQAARKRVQGQIESLEGRLESFQKAKDDAEAELNKERGGIKSVNTTGHAGDGPIAAIKRSIYESAARKFDNESPAILSEISIKKGELEALAGEINKELGVVEEKEAQAAGILNRHKVLVRLLEEDRSSALFAYILMILMMSIEVLPIMQKIFSPKSKYDFMKDEEAKYEKIEAAKIFKVKSSVAKYEAAAHRATFLRVYNKVRKGDFDNGNTPENDLAKTIHMSILKNGGKGAGSSVDAPASETSGILVHIEVAEHPELTAKLTIPAGKEQSLTLEDLKQQIDQLVGEVSADLGKAVELAEATNSGGDDIDRHFLPLTPQLKADRRLILRFEPASAQNDTRL